MRKLREVDRAVDIMSTIIIAVLIFGFSSFILIAMANADYNRYSYGGWRDDDRDCLNTRHEVLAEESLITPIILDCKVIYGVWYDLYTGEVITNPRKLDVDHVVPIKEANDSGAEYWSSDMKRRYYNDLDNPAHLIAVGSSINRSKGSRDLADWLPPNESFHCAYVKMWQSVKNKWGLSMDSAERRVAMEILRDCTLLPYLFE